MTPWNVAHQVLLSMGFPRQEYWSGLQCSPPGDLPNPGIEPVSPELAGRFFIAEPPEKPNYCSKQCQVRFWLISLYVQKCIEYKDIIFL